MENEQNQISNAAGATSGLALSMPAAIVVAGVLIAGSVFVSARMNVQPTVAPAAAGGNNNLPQREINMRPVSSDEALRGDKNGKVIVVTYSDTECPFCKRFHNTMNQVMKGYPSNVAWVYRYYPLDALHQKARKEAEAVECANELGGGEKRWQYLDRIYEVTPSNDGLDSAELGNIAKYIGLDKAKFQACLDSGKFAAKVEADAQDAVSAGAQGTPYSIVISPKGNKIVIDGAFPLAEVKKAIDAAATK